MQIGLESYYAKQTQLLLVQVDHRAVDLVLPDVEVAHTDLKVSVGHKW